MKLAPGTRLGPYEVEAFIGAGGMGEVYRARDTRLGRSVALKILPGALSQDMERLARFRREAHLLASLNHPHIAAIYGLEETEGRLALALELVEGEGLDSRLTRGPIAIDDALSIGRQIAEGIENAHERGIVHRDLKPANVKLTPDGNVKLLDFGLAKAYEREAAEAGTSSLSNSPTLTRQPTEAGMILGTAAYMSPEQARGKQVDKRADIWAFGVVLYEMLAGRRLFEGDTVSDTLAAVLTREPDFSALPPATSRATRDLLRRCLQRDVKQRLRDIGEARITLSQPGRELVTERLGASPSIESRGRWRRALPWLVLTVVLGMGVMIVPWWPSHATPTDAPLLSLGIDAGGDTPLAGVGWIGLHWVGPTAVLSPDGRLLAFIARGPSGGRWQLYTRRLDELKAIALAGTEGAYAPFFSPDGRSIAFFAGGRLMKVALNGGTVTTICPAEEARGGAWAEDGTILFAPRPDGPLFRVSSDGGTTTPATTIDAASGETTHRWPQALPGGKAFLFTAHSDTSTSRAGTIVVWSATDGRRTIVHRGGLYGRYAPSGHLLYVQEGKLFAAAFDVGRLEVTGRPVPVVDEVAHALINGSAQFSFSDTGLLAYRRARSANRFLQWMDVAGQVQTMRSVAAEYQEARFSPDGTRLVLVIGEGAQSDVWVYHIARDTMSRLTFHPDNDWSPIWSPEGSHIAYGSWRADVGTFNLFLHRTDGTGEPERLTSSRNWPAPRRVASERKIPAVLRKETGHRAGPHAAPPGTHPDGRVETGNPKALAEQRVQRAGGRVLAGRKVAGLHVR